MASHRFCKDCHLWQNTLFSFATGNGNCALFTDSTELTTTPETECPLDWTFIRSKGEWDTVKENRDNPKS